MESFTPAVESQEKPHAISIERNEPALISVGLSAEFKDVLKEDVTVYLASLAEGFRYVLDKTDILFDVMINEAENTVEIKPLNAAIQIPDEVVRVIEKEIQESNKITGME